MKIWASFLSALILLTLNSCHYDDPCTSYDSAIETIFFFPWRGVWDDFSVQSMLPYDEDRVSSMEVTFFLNGDTICRSSRHSTNAWSAVDIKYPPYHPSIAFYYCKTGSSCNQLGPLKKQQLKMEYKINRESGTEFFSDSVSVSPGIAYGFFLEENLEQTIAIYESDYRFDNLHCTGGLCSFSSPKAHLVCKESALGNKCFPE